MTQPAEIPSRPELVIGIAGAAGTRLDDVSTVLKNELQTFGYQTIDIRLSSLLENFTWGSPQGTGEFYRIRYLQDKGDEFRTRLQDGAALARASIAEIRKKRAEISNGDPDLPVSSHAYILHQLKHPDEVELLRRVYGPAFLMVAVHAPRPLRVEELANKMWRKDNQTGAESSYAGKANDIIDIDEKQKSDFGQNTRDTYPKADFFANLADPSGHYRVKRFIDLVFGHPFHTPKPDEYAMYLASAVSLRSSDDNRQVGAVIARVTGDDHNTMNVDVIASGMNEVPRGGGGFYWDENSPDARDQWLLYHNGEDRAQEIKVSALTELIQKIKDGQWLKAEKDSKSAVELAREILPNLKRTQFLDIGEFSRPVHAEMAALIDSARRGVAVDGLTIYVTTFPCHNCAKHIIAAGLKKVVYLEPYSKSRTSNLHKEAISLAAVEPGKVVFSLFTGIAPSQYRQLFSMSERGAKKGKSLAQWELERLTLRPLYVPDNASRLYIFEERQALEKLPTEIYRWDKTVFCPVI